MFLITFNGQTVGSAEVQTEGCFYKISCSCDALPNRGNRIYATDGKETIDLGICVPKGNRFVLTKRVPVKRLIWENLRFSIASADPNVMAVPVETGTAFSKLDKLACGKFSIRDGQPQILIDLA